MKICFIGNTDSIHLQNWSKWFIDHGYDVHLIGFSKGNYLLRLIRTHKKIREIQPDIINGHYAGNTEVFAASFYHRCPLVVTTYGSDILIDMKISRLKRFLIKHVLKRADVITVEGGTVQDKLLKMDINSNKLKQICFGTDTNMFHPVNTPVYPTQVVLSLRNGKSIYDIETLLKAEPLVLRECPNTQFILLGGQLEIPHDVIPMYLFRADVYVSTALSDSGLASSTAEAMACEVPIVVTGVCDNMEWVTGAGFFFPPGDYKALAEKIIILLKHRQLREELGRQGRRTILERHEYDKEMRKVERVFVNEELIARMNRELYKT